MDEELGRYLGRHRPGTWIDAIFLDLCGSVQGKRYPGAGHQVYGMAALDRLERSQLLRDWLGGDYVDVYCGTKRPERAAFLDHISAREHDWYL